MWTIISLIIGTLIGAALTLFFILTDVSGTLRVKTDQDEMKYLFLELSKEVPQVLEKRYVLFKVAPRE